jgi:heavy metal sensor kinase
MVGSTALLLVAVVVSFGALLHGRAEDALLSAVDASLEERGRALAGALEWEEEGWELDLSPEYLRGLVESMWFEITDDHGAMIADGGSPSPLAATGAEAPRPLGFRDDGDDRELRLAGPHGSLVRIGRSIVAERAESRELLAWIAAGGAAIVALALAGGWWLAGRTLAPIARISRTAEGLSERDLSGRIDLRAVPAELRGLAGALNEAFARLEGAFARQARFTADASHELRTPVAVVRAQAESALRREHTPDDYREALGACLRAAERMTGIVEGLLSLARLAAGDGAGLRAPVALDEVVRGTVELARPAADQADVAITADLLPVRVTGHPELLAEVASNLISNAIRYNRPGGRVRIELRAANGMARLQITDDGPGIPAEALPHLFERFYRVDPDRSREKGGSGLGLAIAHAIVVEHGGTIAAESTEGSGSVFTVTLPAAES